LLLHLDVDLLAQTAPGGDDGGSSAHIRAPAHKLTLCGEVLSSPSQPGTVHSQLGQNKTQNDPVSGAVVLGCGGTWSARFQVPEEVVDGARGGVYCVGLGTRQGLVTGVALGIAAGRAAAIGGAYCVGPVILTSAS
jgi:hypothetical protein